MKEELDKFFKTLTIADAVLTGLGIVFAVIARWHQLSISHGNDMAIREPPIIYA
jgi:hypothetical protein